MGSRLHYSTTTTICDDCLVGWNNEDIGINCWVCGKFGRLTSRKLIPALHEAGHTKR